VPAEAFVDPGNLPMMRTTTTLPEHGDPRLKSAEALCHRRQE